VNSVIAPTICTLPVVLFTDHASAREHVPTQTKTIPILYLRPLLLERLDVHVCGCQLIAGDDVILVIVCAVYRSLAWLVIATPSGRRISQDSKYRDQRFTSTMRAGLDMMMPGVA